MAEMTRRTVSWTTPLHLDAGIGLEHRRQRLPRQRHVAQVDHVEEPRPQAIIDVMGIIGDIVGKRRDLRLG